MNIITTCGLRLVDELGRERIFNGINLCDKSVYNPDEKQGYDEAELDTLLRRFRDAGLNLIRLGFTWAKLEPEQGVYNEAYIDNIAMLLDKCEQYGIYVYLDMHQDVYAAAIGSDGAPDWAVLTDGHEIKPAKFVWAEPYFWGKACHAAFDNFWKNTPVNGKGLQDSYAELWQHLAERLGKKPAVIGFDMMNEPFPGSDGGKVFKAIVKGAVKAVLFDKEIKRGKLIRDLFSKDRIPKVLNQITGSVVRRATSGADELIRKFDTGSYSQFLDKTATAINEVNDEKIYFLENSYYSNLGIPYSTPEIKVNGERAKNQLFAPHAYDFMVDTPLYKYASNDRVGTIFAEHKRSQERLGVPVIVGEWGGSGGSDNSDWLPHISFLLDLFDKNKWSNTYWAYYDGFLDTPLMSVFSRPYPRAVAGNINAYTYDLNERIFYLDFDQPKEMAKVPTLIAAPFPVESVSIDGKEVKFKQNEAEIELTTTPGSHYVKVIFQK